MLIQKHIVNPRKHLESGGSGGGSANNQSSNGDGDDEESLVDNDPLSQSESVRCLLLFVAFCCQFQHFFFQEVFFFHFKRQKIF